MQDLIGPTRRQRAEYDVTLFRAMKHSFGKGQSLLLEMLYGGSSRPEPAECFEKKVDGASHSFVRIFHNFIVGIVNVTDWWPESQLPAFCLIEHAAKESRPDKM